MKHAASYDAHARRPASRRSAIRLRRRTCAVGERDQHADPEQPPRPPELPGAPPANAAPGAAARSAPRGAIAGAAAACGAAPMVNAISGARDTWRRPSRGSVQAISIAGNVYEPHASKR